MACWTHFFKQALAVWPNFWEYKQRLFTCQRCFSCSMNGLNCVLSICMGSSLGANTICLGCNMGGMNCFNVGNGSQRFFYQCLESWISQHIAWAITWLKVVGSNMVNRRSFTSPWSPNWNWLMNVASSHEISHASCINSKVYIETGRDPWQIVHNLLLVVCSLFESSKEAPNSSKNASKLFRRKN